VAWTCGCATTAPPAFGGQGGGETPDLLALALLAHPGAAMATLTKLDHLPLTLLTSRPAGDTPGRCRLRCCFLGRACLSGGVRDAATRLGCNAELAALLLDPTVARPNFLKGRSTEWSTNGR
jgi:hypothetical protein